MGSYQYQIDGHTFSYTDADLLVPHASLCAATDADFLQRLPEALHLACMLCFVRGIPSSECLSDRGVVHQIAHLIHLDEPAVSLFEVRQAFADLVPESMARRGTIAARPATEWQCEPHDSGWLVIAKVGEFALARHIGFNEWREAHDQSWLMTSVIRTLGRNAERLEVSHG